MTLFTHHSYISTKFYGVDCGTLFDRTLHAGREHQTFIDLDMRKMVRNHFYPIINKVSDRATCLSDFFSSDPSLCCCCFVLEQGDVGFVGEGKSRPLSLKRSKGTLEWTFTTTLYAFTKDQCNFFIFDREGEMRDGFVKMAEWKTTIKDLESIPELRSALSSHERLDGLVYYSLNIMWTFQLYGPELRAELSVITPKGLKR